MLRWLEKIRMYNRGKQIIVGELSLLLMSMNFLITLSNKLTYETSKIQKPHGIPFNLIVFKTEITVWFYWKVSFSQPLFAYM